MGSPQSLEEVATELAKVYGAITTLSTEVNGKLDRICDRLDHTDDATEELKATVKELGNRVTSLERTKWLIAGAAAFMGAAPGTVTQIFGS